MYPRNCMNATAVSCDVSSTSATASSGSPALTAAWRSSATTARLDSSAEDEPRRNAALPALMHSPAASLVTFGRFS